MIAVEGGSQQDKVKESMFSVAESMHEELREEIRLNEQVEKS